VLEHGGVVRAGFQPLGQVLEERALLEVPTQARVDRGQAVKWDHLLDRVCPAEQHHDFFEVWTGHQVPLFSDGGSKTDATTRRRAEVSSISLVVNDLDELAAGSARRGRFRTDEYHDRQKMAQGAKSGRNGENRPRINETREVLRKFAGC
jgi:hypothetical protein